MRHAHLVIVETALANARHSWMSLVQMSAHYVSGTLAGYEPLSRGAHIASCDLKTLSQSMDWACLGEQAHVMRLAAAADDLFARTMENEQSSSMGALARSQVYFDDLLDPDDLSPLRILVQRSAHELHDSSAQEQRA